MMRIASNGNCDDGFKVGSGSLRDPDNVTVGGLATLGGSLLCQT